MEDSINNLGLVTTDKDVNNLAARHCEDAQVSLLFKYPPSDCKHCFEWPCTRQIILLISCRLVWSSRWRFFLQRSAVQIVLPMYKNQLPFWWKPWWNFCIQESLIAWRMSAFPHMINHMNVNWLLFLLCNDVLCMCCLGAVWPGFLPEFEKWVSEMCYCIFRTCSN